jgi:copper(I)-binding protein
MMEGSVFKVWVIGIFIALALTLTACGAGGGELQVNDAWARPGLAGGNSAVFFLIDNPGSADLLLSVDSDVAEAVELHKTVMQDETMQMVQQMNVPVPTGETVFRPGDLHVMLIGLKNELQPGDTFTVTANFETAGEQTLNVTVKEP